MGYCCIKLTFDSGISSGVIEFEQTGIPFNNFDTFEFIVDGITHYVWHSAVDTWYITTSPIGDITTIVAELKNNIDPCPYASKPAWITTWNVLTTESGNCFGNCACIKILFQNDKLTSPLVYELSANGKFNNRNWYDFQVGSDSYYIFWSGSQWLLTSDSLGGTNIKATLSNDVDCPFGNWDSPENILFAIVPCGECFYFEEREFRQYKAIKFPEIFVEQNRGLKDCCCKQLVLAGNGNESWKNDKSSAWIKLSDELDSVGFVLKKNGIVTNYIPTISEFINEPNAFFTTINWADVLVSDGVGCYTLEISFDISGATGSFIWSEYTLKLYTIENALTTARVRAIFSGYHETDGIDFTGSNVESTHRFNGFIGFRQPNTEIDNIIYSNREMKRVIRENLNDYEISTDPSDECIIKPLIDLYLLSENQLFISDYNAHNHSYRYLDLPVIVSESPSVEYKELSRKAVLTCKVSDKFKQNRTYYNG